MRMTQLSPNNQTSNNKLSKPTEEQLQNELHFHLVENMLMKLREEELISQEEFNQISKLNRQKFNPLLGPLMCDKP
ncbi:SHOCT domain-containing protein [Paraliobacillus sp. JSM ZJ581]|uniref:SHOCT domain-containing protein n=1 Tax=Paraliobacillus sp. JSM ZJ581 TaxID=3342118 RepID=UPI0035A8EE34